MTSFKNHLLRCVYPSSVVSEKIFSEVRPTECGLLCIVCCTVERYLKCYRYPAVSSALKPHEVNIFVDGIYRVGRMVRQRYQFWSEMVYERRGCLTQKPRKHAIIFA